MPAKAPAGPRRSSFSRRRGVRSDRLASDWIYDFPTKWPYSFPIWHLEPGFVIEVITYKLQGYKHDQQYRIGTSHGKNRKRAVSIADHGFLYWPSTRVAFRPRPKLHSCTSLTYYFWSRPLSRYYRSPVFNVLDKTYKQLYICILCIKIKSIWTNYFLTEKGVYCPTLNGKGQIPSLLLASKIKLSAYM